MRWFTTAALWFLSLSSQIGPKAPLRKISDLPLPIDDPQAKPYYASFGFDDEGKDFACIDLSITSADIPLLEDKLNNLNILMDGSLDYKYHKFTNLTKILKNQFQHRNFEMIVNGTRGFSPVHLAALFGDTPQLQYYLQFYNADDVSCENTTPLLLALILRHKYVVKALLQAGAQPNKYISSNSTTMSIARKLLMNDKELKWADRLFKRYQYHDPIIPYIYTLLQYTFLALCFHFGTSIGTHMFKAFIENHQPPQNLPNVDKESKLMRANNTGRKNTNKKKKQISESSISTSSPIKSVSLRSDNQSTNNNHHVTTLPEHHVKVVNLNTKITDLPESLPFHKEQIHQTAWDIINHIKDKKFIVDIAGGAVLAAMQNTKPNDIDLVVYGTSIDKIQQLLPYESIINEDPDNCDNKSLTIKDPDGNIDIVAHADRKKSYYKRDFTINAIHYNANKDCIYNIGNSVTDYIKSIINTVIEPSKKLDSTYLLRMIRSLAKTKDNQHHNGFVNNRNEFIIHSDIRKTIKSMTDANKTFAIDRRQLGPELMKCFLNGKAAENTLLINQYDILYIILPQYQRLDEQQRSLANQYLTDMAQRFDNLFAQTKQGSPNFSAEQFADEHLALLHTFIWGIPLKVLNDETSTMNQHNFTKETKSTVLIPERIIDQNNQYLGILDHFSDYSARYFFNKKDTLYMPHDKYDIVKEFFNQEFSQQYKYQYSPI